MGNGGAIDAAPQSNLSILTSRFERNHALNGGAIYHFESTAIIQSSVFFDNVATVSLLEYSSATISRCTKLGVFIADNAFSHLFDYFSLFLTII